MARVPNDPAPGAKKSRRPATYEVPMSLAREFASMPPASSPTPAQAATPGKATQPEPTQAAHAAAAATSPAYAAIRALIDAAKYDRTRCASIMFALEDAKARVAPGDREARVELPDRLDDVAVTPAELDVLLNYLDRGLGVARSTVASTGADRMAPTEVLYEQMGHCAEGHTLDTQWLALQGYRSQGDTVQAGWGLTFHVYVPLQPGEDAAGRVRVGAHPVLAFYGTDMGSGDDLGEDAVPQGVGYRQTNFNRGLLGKTLGELDARYGRVAVCGHSLGGANAQMTATLFPDLVASVHTYQSPGINAQAAAELAKHNADPHANKIRSTHYHVPGEFVEDGGEAWTEGTFVDHRVPIDQDGWENLNPFDVYDDAKIQHDTMLATRTWLDRNPDIRTAHPGLETSPHYAGSDHVTEIGRRSTAGVTGPDEGARKWAAGDGWAKQIAKQLDHIEGYRKKLRESRDLRAAWAMVDADKDERGGQGGILTKLWAGDDVRWVKRDLWMLAQQMRIPGIDKIPYPA